MCRGTIGGDKHVEKVSRIVEFLHDGIAWIGDPCHSTILQLESIGDCIERNLPCVVGLCGDLE